MPSRNLFMLDARLAHAFLAAGLVFCACGSSHRNSPGGSGSGGPAAGSSGSLGGGGAAGGSGGSSGAAVLGGSGNGVSVPNCGPLGGAMAGARSGASGQSSAASAPAPIGTDLGTLTVESVATWKGAAEGAYTIIHDDLCADDTDILDNADGLFTIAEPELTQRGLRAAFGAIVERCQARNLWPQLETLRAHGHEIINHSWDHKDLVKDTAATLDQQLDVASRALDQNLVNQHTSFFIFPYDSFNDAVVAHVGRLGYLGARAGRRGVNDASFSDGLRVMFDVYQRPTSEEKYSIYWSQPDIMKYYVDLAISYQGWAVREFHGVADATFEPVPLADYQAHLDYVKSKQEAGNLWVDTPSAILRYHFSRIYCGAPRVSGHTLVPAQPSCECGYYSTPLSVIVTTTTDAPSALGAQDGAMMATKKLGPSRFLVEVNPLGGPVTVGGGN